MILDDRALAHPPWGGPEPKQPDKVDLPIEALEAMLNKIFAGVEDGQPQSATESLIQALEYNPYHKPAGRRCDGSGPGSGQFASKGGMGGGIVNPKDARIEDDRLAT